MEGMDEHESADQTLGEIFVSVTGETVITDQQNQETHKKVISAAESDLPPDE